MNSRIIINLKKIRENAIAVKKKCDAAGVEIAAVTKMHCCDINICRELLDAGIHILADSRLDNLKKIEKLKCKKWLIRIPSVSDAEDVVKYCDVSLNSELETVRALNTASLKAGKRHGVILMFDLGDLREGWFDESAYFKAAEEIASMKGVDFLGIGTSLSCYGAILPTHENLGRLIKLASETEKRFNVKLKYISGGSSTSYSLIQTGEFPQGINNLRIGDTIYCGRDDITRQYLPYLHDDCFVFESEIAEIKDKPSIPIGKSGYASLNRKPEFSDKGIRKRAICSAGRQDTDTDMLSFDENAFVMEASSDHLLVDITDSKKAYKIGDRMRFKMLYASIMRAFTSPYIEKVYINE